MPDRVPASQLSDDELRHQLAQLKSKQAEIEAGGTRDQKDNHAARTAELEKEFLQRSLPGDDSEGPADPQPEDGG